MNLSYCSSISIDIYIPAEIKQETLKLYEDLKSSGYNLFDKNDKFYTDICTPYKSENGTDVLLSDRFNDFYKANELGCQENCEYSDFSPESQYLKCECNVIEKEEMELEEPEKFTAKSILTSFVDVLKYSNYKVLKCSELVFNKKSFYENYGSILTIIYLLGFIASFILYCFKRMNNLKLEIQKLMQNKLNDVNSDNQSINSNNNKNKDVIIYKNNVLNTNNKNSYNSKLNKADTLVIKGKKIGVKNLNSKRNMSKKRTLDINYNENKKGKFPPKKQIIIKKPIKKKSIPKVKLFSDLVKEIKMMESNRILFNNEMNSNSQQIVNIINNNDAIKNENKIKSLKVNEKKVKEEKNSNENYTDYELNSLEYLEALEYDNRNFFRIYWSLLKREHLIIFTFLLGMIIIFSVLNYPNFFMQYAQIWF